VAVWRLKTKITQHDHVIFGVFDPFSTNKICLRTPFHAMFAACVVCPSAC